MFYCLKQLEPKCGYPDTDTVEVLNLYIPKCRGSLHNTCLCFFSLVSDLKIKVGNKRISAHKFVLAARSDTWSLANLASTEELDLSGQSLLSNVMPPLSLG